MTVNARAEGLVDTTTATNPRAVLVKANESTPVLAANRGRNGLNLLNDSTNNIYFRLADEGAELHKDFVLGPTGSWDGIISGKLWLGAICAIAAVNSNLLVAEV